MKLLVILPLLLLISGSIVYCALAILAAARYRHDSSGPLLRQTDSVSILRPLSGAADNTAENLHSVFRQNYGDFEVLLSVHEESDAAAAVARDVMAAYPRIASKLIVAGTSPLPNAKVWSLRALSQAATHETIVMTDSDVHMPPDCVSTLMGELAGNSVSLVTCPYRAVGGASFWPRIEALGLNTEFLAGMLTARMLNGMDYAIGCTIATRKSDLGRIGGLAYLQNYLAEDFMMGHLLHRAGRKVILSRSIIDHHIGGEGFLSNWKHRLRWARSTRRSRGWAYVGELFTKTTGICVLLLIVSPGAWGFVLTALLFRAAAAWFTGEWILNDPALRQRWYLLPIEDLASCLTWVLGFFGKTITWRGRDLVIQPDGRFEGM